MRGQGITYDTGFVRGGTKSERFWDLQEVIAELRTIRDDLHCTAVRVTGGDPERIDAAARLAVELGLEVWYSPYPLELTHDEILALFADCADRAERLRSEGGEIVFVTGAELSCSPRHFREEDLSSTPEPLSSRKAALGGRARPAGRCSADDVPGVAVVGRRATEGRRRAGGTLLA